MKLYSKLVLIGPMSSEIEVIAYSILSHYAPRYEWHLPNYAPICTYTKEGEGNEHLLISKRPNPPSVLCTNKD